MEEEEKIKKQQEEINCVFIVSSPAKGKTNIIKNILLSHSKYFDEVYIFGDYKINYEYIDFESYCIINKLPDRIDVDKKYLIIFEHQENPRITKKYIESKTCI